MAGDEERLQAELPESVKDAVLEMMGVSSYPNP